MRGRRDPQATMLAFVDLEERVRTDHPLRTFKTVADGALERLSPEFDQMYFKVGRASAPPDDGLGNPSVDSRGERRSNETHQGGTRPEARLMRRGKGTAAKLALMGHALMENRNGMLLDFMIGSATGAVERDAVPALMDDGRRRRFPSQNAGRGQRLRHAGVCEGNA